MRRRVAVVALTVAAGCLAALVAAAGAGPDSAVGPVAPLPVRGPDPTPSGTAPQTRTAGTGTTSSVPATAPTPRRTPRRPLPTTGRPPPTPPPAGPSSACLGAIRYDLDLANSELALIRSLCFATGAVLRIQGIGPGEVTAEPAELVAQSYEAGVVDIRFVRPGTVLVTIPQDDRTYPITVVVR